MHHIKNRTAKAALVLLFLIAAGAGAENNYVPASAQEACVKVAVTIDGDPARCMGFGIDIHPKFPAVLRCKIHGVPFI